MKRLERPLVPVLAQMEMDGRQGGPRYAEPDVEWFCPKVYGGAWRTEIQRAGGPQSFNVGVAQAVGRDPV